MAEVKGKTSSGFEFSFDDNVVDMEMLDNLVEAEENPAYIGKIIGLMLGKEQKKDLYDHLRDENGKVPIEKTATCLIEFFNAIKDGKNS